MASTGRWLPNEIYEIADGMVRLITRMASAAKAEAKETRSLSGVYAVALLFNKDGELLGDPSTGKPFVTLLPMAIAEAKHGTVAFYHPDQRIRPNSVANLAAVDRSTVWRAVKEGKLPEPTKQSERVSTFKLADVQKWITAKASEG